MLGLIAATAAFVKCGNSSAAENDITARIPVRDDTPIYLDSRNPYTRAKAELGRYLFYDRRLSINNTRACASCHAQEFSFTDSYDRSAGAFGDLVPRNSRPLINIIFNKYLTASDSTIHFPEQQIINPLYNEHPVEMGMKGNEELILQRFAKDSLYREKFIAAFPLDKDPFTIQNLQWAISSFVKSILSFQSAYDRYNTKKDTSMLTVSQRNGMQLFFSDSLQCNSCHGGITFSTPSFQDDKADTIFYFNTGIYTPTDALNNDEGLATLTGKKEDRGKFRVPTLRNLAFTAPYLHDGSAATLEDVVSLYENAGQHTNETKNDQKHPPVKRFRLNSQEKKELIAFLLSLSDSTLCRNPDYANPFPDDETKRQHDKK